MIGKPFILENAIQDVVKASGGNKKIIAQQAQMGLIDPTSAVLAGMYIDRIREAEAAEKEQAATVAEQVFSPKPQPEAVSQMQLAQQGLGSAPTPAPKMPAGVNMGMGATPQAAQMQAMQQKMAPRPSVAGMNQLPMGPGMIPKAASGGLLAFAGGGDVPGYNVGGTPELDIGALTDYSQYGPALEAQQKAEAEALAKQQAEEEFKARDVGTIFGEFKGLQNELLPGGENYFAKMQELYSPDAIEKKAEKAQALADTRRSDDFYRSITLGALQGLANPTPSTGQFFSDAVIGLGTAAKGAAPGILAGEERYRTAQDKIIDMRNEAPEKQLAILGQQRAELAALLPQAIATRNVERELQIKKQIEDNKNKTDALKAQASRNVKIIEAESIVAQKIAEYQAENNGRYPNDYERTVMFNKALENLDLRGKELEVALKEGMAVFDLKVKLFADSKKVYTDTYDKAMDDSVGWGNDPVFQSAKGDPIAQQAAKEDYAHRRAKEAADMYLQNESPQPITYDSLLRTFNPTNQPLASSNTNNNNNNNTTSAKENREIVNQYNAAEQQKVADIFYANLEKNPDKFRKEYKADQTPGGITVFNNAGRKRYITNADDMEIGEYILNSDNVIYKKYPNGRVMPVERTQK